MTAIPVDYEIVLQLVYQLPARQRFALIHDVLKSLEPTPAKQPTLPRTVDPLETDQPAPTDETIQAWRDEQRQEHDFWENRSIHELAQSQKVTPVKNIDELCTNAWPADESIEDFLATIRVWRKVDAPAHSVLEHT